MKGNLYAFIPRNCNKNGCKNVVAQKVLLNEETYTINFSSCDNLEISKSEDHNRHILTHILSVFLRVYENKWSGSESPSYKLHKKANNLLPYLVGIKRQTFNISSSEDEEKENVFERTKRKYKKIESDKAKVPKVLPIRKDYRGVCQHAMAAYIKEKEALTEQVSKFTLEKSKINFLETDFENLKNKIREI